MYKLGIYKIYFKLEPNKIYIGSTSNLKRRKSEHFSKLRKQRKHNPNLQEYYNKYGEQDLIFEVIEYCIKEKLLEREQFYIDTLKPIFNISSYSDSTKGVRTSEETKQKLSVINKGKKFTEERCKKMSETFSGENNPFFGKHHSEESKKKISESNNYRKKPILQFDLQGNFIREWESIQTANKITKINRCSISHCVNNISKIAGGYIWKFKPILNCGV